MRLVEIKVSEEMKIKKRVWVMIFTEILTFIILSCGALVIGFWILVFTLAILYFLIDIFLNVILFVARCVLAVPLFFCFVLKDFVISKMFSLYLIVVLIYLS